MFESAEIGHSIDKETYDAEVPALREALLEAQYELKQKARFPVIVLINGIEGAGKGETVKLLNEWMDPRMIDVLTFDQQTDEELARPPAWRYWRALPPKGRMGVFFGNWYSQMLQGRVHGVFKDAVLDQAIAGAERLEQMLCDEGALIIKFWFHLSKKQMKARLKSLKDDPLHSWRISRWTGSNRRPTTVSCGSASACCAVPARLCALAHRRRRRPELPQPGGRAHPAGEPAGRAGRQPQGQAPGQYRTAGPQHRPAQPAWCTGHDLAPGQAGLPGATDDRAGPPGRPAAAQAHAPACPGGCLEGNDAAGKGGAIRRVAAALDPRQYRIVPIAAPTEEERAQPYLWRFWRHIPARGKFTIFDRSWYGRVLVERVEGFCTPSDWMRAYSEINDFEEQLVNAGVVLVKFWLAIDQQTQLERFEEREQIPFKRYKITEDDWRNRDKWDEYTQLSATWSTAPAARLPRGRWWRPMTSAGRG